MTGQEVTLVHEDGRKVVLAEQDGGIIERWFPRPKPGKKAQAPRKVEISADKVSKAGGMGAAIGAQVAAAKAKGYAEQGEPMVARSEGVPKASAHETAQFLCGQGWRDAQGRKPKEGELPELHHGDCRVAFVVRERADGPDITLVANLGPNHAKEALVGLMLSGQELIMVNGDDEQVDAVGHLKKLAREGRIDDEMITLLHERKILVDPRRQTVESKGNLFSIAI